MSGWGPAALALVLAAAADGDPVWHQARTPAIEILTDAPAARAAEAAARVERLRAVLAQVAPVPPLDTSDALVLLVSDEAAYRALRPRRDGTAYEVDGFVQGGGPRPLVAARLDGAAPDPLRVLDHEYVHLALNGALPAQPLWVSEGLAELYSDWREDQGGVHLGDLRPENVRLLRDRTLLPVDTVLAAGYTGVEFRDARTREVLYAESWALVRLVLDGGGAAGRARFLRFLRALEDGDPAPEAFRSAFGFSTAEAVPRLQRSLDVGQGPPALRATLPPPVVPMAALPAPAGRASAIQGLLLLGQERDREARRSFEEALRADPDQREAHEGLVQLALKRGDWAEARRALDAARRGRPDDPALLYRAADLVVRQATHSPAGLTDAVEREAAALVERAVARAPRYAAAVDLLARLRPEPRRLRIRQLKEAIAHNPGRPELSFTLASLYLNAQDPGAAAAVLRQVRDTTRDETFLFLADHMLGKLGASTAGTAEATGLWRGLECQPGGVLDFLVEADLASITGGVAVVMKGRGGAVPRPAPVLLRLRAPAPSAVLLQDAEGTLLQPQLICGPQSAAVRVRYRVVGGNEEGVSGVLMTLRLLDRRPDGAGPGKGR